MGKTLKEMVKKGRLREAYEMNLPDIRVIAKTWGADPGVGRTKQDIICDIQVSEGYSPCFCTKDTFGGDCLWKKDRKNNK